MKRLISALILATAVTAGTVACGTEEAPTPTEQAIEGGTLRLESVEWVKNTSSAPEVTEYEGNEGETHEFRNMFGDEEIEVLEITETDIRVRVTGTYFTGDGMETDPEFTLADGDTARFHTASADAGVDYELTYRR